MKNKGLIIGGVALAVGGYIVYRRTVATVRQVVPNQQAVVDVRGKSYTLTPQKGYVLQSTFGRISLRFDGNTVYLNDKPVSGNFSVVPF